MVTLKKIGEEKIGGRKYKHEELIKTDNPQKFLVLGGFELVNENKKVEVKEEVKKEEVKKEEDKKIDNYLEKKKEKKKFNNYY